MTISSEDRKAGPFPGDGVTVNFDFEFKVFADTDVLVIQAVTATGAETQKTITTDYTVTLNPNQESSPGGRVTMLVAPPAGQTITLTSEVPNLQGKTITNLGGFFPQVLNDALDRLTVLVQQVKEKVNRSLKVAISTADGFEATLPAPVPNQLIGWNTAGDGFQNYAGASSTLVSSAMAPVVAAADVAAARSLLGSGAAGDALFLTATAAAARAVIGAAASGAVGSSGLTMATNRLLGRTTASTGAPEEITVGAGLSLSGGALSADTVSAQPPVRQTVLSGPVDSSGLPNFGGSTGSTTVTASGTLVPTAANGNSNRTGSITNPSWTGLSTNGTMYLYLDIAADGACTPGSTTLAPTYRRGGEDVVTNNQNTFNIQEMQMKVGNGSTASQVWRVFVGQVTVAAGVVSAIVWYALMGRYRTEQVTLANGTAYNFNHNIGVQDLNVSSYLYNKTAEFGYSVGDRLYAFGDGNTGSGSAWYGLSPSSTALAITLTTGASGLGGQVNKTTGGLVAFTTANWGAGVNVERAW